MNFKRFFSNTDAKGTPNYINSQKIYEIVKTILLFSVSAALFIGGWVQTGKKENLLTIVAVLGCLPASKSAVSAIMYLRYKSCPNDLVTKINNNASDMKVLFDCVFTSYKKNYVIQSLCVKDKTICGLSTDSKFSESDFQKHISELLKLDGHKDFSIKIFTSEEKYINRLQAMKELEDSLHSDALIYSLKNVML